MTNSPFNIQHASFTAAAIAALAAAVYANALANGLVWDDPIVLQRQLLAFRSVGDLIFPPRNIPQFSPDYYRPLTTLSYLLDRAIGGSGPFMFHLSVVLYHVVATYLVFRLGLALFASTGVASVATTVGAALFAVHPIHTESVAWGAGRSDVLACCFAALAALAHLQARWTPGWRATIAALLCFLAVLAKETAVGMFVILPLMDLILPREQAAAARPAGRAERHRQRQPAPAPPSFVIRYAPLGVAFAVYFILRQVALGTIVGRANALGVDSIIAILAAVGLYGGKLLLPVAQSAYISDLPASPIALAATCALIASAIVACWSTWRRGERLVTLLVVWIGVMLAPSLAIVAKIPAAPVAERYLYLPSVGFCLLAGYGAARVWGSVAAGAGRVAISVTVVIALCAGAAATIRRNAVWRSNLSLWEDTAAQNTTDALPMRSLAVAYLDRGDVAKAQEHFELALKRRNDPIGRYTIYNNLGSIAMRQQRLEDAERYYRTALSSNPQAPDCVFNLGLIALTRAMHADASHDAAWKHDQAQRARQLFDQAAQLSPLDPEIQVALGQALSALGDASAARARYERALQLGLPSTTEAAVRKLLAQLP